MKKLKEVKRDFCPAGCGAGFYPSGLFRPKELRKMNFEGLFLTVD